MIYFDSDYMECAHPLILERIAKINYDKNVAYSQDHYCKEAADKIRKECACPEAGVFYLPGGTQANATVIDFLLRGYQGVISAATGHIHTHEAGAIEAYGHKILAIEGTDGKLSARSVKAYLDLYRADTAMEHLVQPAMVYISHPTEMGTLYSKAELTALSELCRSEGLYLYLDGARMGYALASETNDLSLADIASLCDAFYIGGTKCGALFGEAVVFPDPSLCRNFFTNIKRHGGVTAKGWLCGIQFDTLFTDGLYVNICRNATGLAKKLRDGLVKKGYELCSSSPANQVFVIFPDKVLASLEGKASVCIWERHDAQSTVVRLTTSWATEEAAVDEFLSLV